MKITLGKSYNDDSKYLAYYERIYRIMNNLENINLDDILFLCESKLAYGKLGNYDLIPCITGKTNDAKYKFALLIIESSINDQYAINAIIEFDGVFVYSDNTYKFEIYSEDFPKNIGLNVSNLYILTDTDLEDIRHFSMSNISIKKDWNVSFYTIPGLSGIILPDPNDADNWVDIIRFVDMKYDNTIQCETGYGALYHGLNMILKGVKTISTMKKLSDILQKFNERFAELKKKKDIDNEEELSDICDAIHENYIKIGKFLVEKGE